MSEKNFIVDSENMDAPLFLTDKFEFDLSSRGFRMDKDKEGFYISELTQSAWLGFSLFYAYMSVEEKRIVDDDRVAADDNVEPATPPALKK
ncbi:TPA: hypothetical protein ACTVMT_004206 [Escherichia coli]